MPIRFRIKIIYYIVNDYKLDIFLAKFVVPMQTIHFFFFNIKNVINTMYYFLILRYSRKIKI